MCLLTGKHQNTVFKLAFIRILTKPSPFEIIPLQTTSMEKYWKTEEALARAALSLETERIKGVYVYDDDDDDDVF